MAEEKLEKAGGRASPEARSAARGAGAGWSCSQAFRCRAMIPGEVRARGEDHIPEALRTIRGVGVRHAALQVPESA